MRFDFLTKILTVLAFLLCGNAYAQSAADPVLPGYLTVTGCAGGGTPCFKASASPVNSATGEANHVFKASPGVLYGFSVTTGGAAGYVLVYNAASAPADGSVAPAACYAVPASTTLGVAYTPLPLNLTSGITLVFSTTGCFTQTSSATAFFLGEVL